MSAAASKQAYPAATDQRPPARNDGDFLFKRSDWMLYVTLGDLSQRAGVPTGILPRLVIKEIVDNALDAADKAGRPGAVTLSVEDGNVVVEDHGGGIANAGPDSIAEMFSVSRPLLSSKRWRLPTRGAVGNGLRVVLGYLTATGASLVVETGALLVELQPEALTGKSRVIRTERIDPPLIGTRLTCITTSRPFEPEDGAWADDAIEIASGGGGAYTGRPSPHWLDLDHFCGMLRSLDDDRPVREFISRLDGCQGSAALSRIAGTFNRRTCHSLSVAEAAGLLGNAQSVARDIKPKALGLLGADAVPSGGYAWTEGTFLLGEHEPRATIPTIIEVWADAILPDDQTEPLMVALFINRTRVVVAMSGGVSYGVLRCSGFGFNVRAAVPARLHYNITVNITAPAYPITSDGKAPDLGPFSEWLAEAISKAAKRAGKDQAQELEREARGERSLARTLSALAERSQRVADREARLKVRAAMEAEREAERRKPKPPTLDDSVRALLPSAIEEAEKDGLPFNTRHLFYAIRDVVSRRSHKTLRWSYFDQLVTTIESEQGDLSPLCYRENRGSWHVPHGHGSTPLGTLNVAAFERPQWTFNKVLVIEKEDFRFALEQAGWGERHDAMVVSSKGYSTRALRDLIDKLAETAEPLTVYCAHDGDAHGTMIYHTLQHETKARGARKIRVVNLGLDPWEGLAMSPALAVEEVEERREDKTKEPKKRRHRAVAQYVLDRTDPAPDEMTWEEWLQDYRIELNAMTTRRMIEWLDRKMEERDDGKVVPPGDLLQAEVEGKLRGAVSEYERARFEAKFQEEVAPIEAEIDKLTKPLEEEIERLVAPIRARIAEITKPRETAIAEHEAAFWASGKYEAAVEEMLGSLVPEPDDIRQEIAGALAANTKQAWPETLAEIVARLTPVIR